MTPLGVGSSGSARPKCVKNFPYATRISPSAFTSISADMSLRKPRTPSRSSNYDVVLSFFFEKEMRDCSNM